MKFIYPLYRYFVYIPMFIVGFTIIGVFAILISLFAGERRGRFLLYWYGFFLIKTVPVKLERIGMEKIDRTRSYVIVSNHRSNFDPVILWGGLLIDLLWIMKIELLRVPVFGFVMKRMGNIGIDRKNSQAAIKSLNSAKARLKNGTSVVFFPEGTRHTGEGVGNFKKGAFHFAQEMELDILPVTIVGSDHIMPPHSIAISYGKAKLIVHDPIPTKGASAQELSAIVEKTKNVIAEGYNRYSLS